MRRRHLSIRDSEDFYTPIHVREKNLRTVFREDQPCETQLSFCVRLQNVARRNLRLRFVLAFVWQSDALQDLSRWRIDYDQLAGLAGGDQNSPVGRQRQSLRAQAGQ